MLEDFVQLKLFADRMSYIRLKKVCIKNKKWWDYTEGLHLHKWGVNVVRYFRAYNHAFLVGVGCNGKGG